MREKNLKILILIFLLILTVILTVIIGYLYFKLNNDNQEQYEYKNFSEFDLSFLKLENKKENKIYSPLSIKYALKILEESTSGKTKKQIDNLIGTYNLPKYESNKNMTFTNIFFTKDSYKDNSLELIPELLQNSDIEKIDYALLSALSIDMEWNHKFLKHDYIDDLNIKSSIRYNHAKKQDEENKFEWFSDRNVM